MAHSLTWLPEVLLKAGLKVAEVPGWETRGLGDVGKTFGVICHHTAGSKHGNMPSLNVLINGRPNLRGPLAQLGLGRDGTYYIIAAGRCNHAGVGMWNGRVNGNSEYIGIEAENTGRADDVNWPAVQMNAYHRGVAAILKHINQTEEFCAAHREYALPAGRKPDTNFDMNRFRAIVHDLLNNTFTPELIPAREETTDSHIPRPTLRRGSSDPLVKVLQQKLGIAVDGNFGPATEAALRAFQRQMDLVPDGILGPKTWKKLDEV